MLLFLCFILFIGISPRSFMYQSSHLFPNSRKPQTALTIQCAEQDAEVLVLGPAGAADHQGRPICPWRGRVWASEGVRAGWVIGY